MIILWKMSPQSLHLSTPSGYYTHRGPWRSSISTYCPDNWPAPEANSLPLYRVINWPDLLLDTVVHTVYNRFMMCLAMNCCYKRSGKTSLLRSEACLSCNFFRHHWANRVIMANLQHWCATYGVNMIQPLTRCITAVSSTLGNVIISRTTIFTDPTNMWALW